MFFFSIRDRMAFEKVAMLEQPHWRLDFCDGVELSSLSCLKKCMHVFESICKKIHVLFGKSGPILASVSAICAVDLLNTLEQSSRLYTPLQQPPPPWQPPPPAAAAPPAPPAPAPSPSPLTSPPSPRAAWLETTIGTTTAKQQRSVHW